MREIKFRGLSEERKKFVYGDLVHIHTANGDAMAIKDTTYHVNDGYINLIPTEIVSGTEGQYTGLKDRNGVEIYEGDIWERDGFVGEVVFEYDHWAFRKTESSKCYQYPSFYSNAHTGGVKGNIYEEVDHG